MRAQNEERAKRLPKDSRGSQRGSWDQINFLSTKPNPFLEMVWQGLLDLTRGGCTGKGSPEHVSIYLMCCRPVGCTASHPPHSSRQGGREGFEAVQQRDFKPAHRQQHGRGCLTATLPKSRPTAPYLSLRISDHYHSFDHRIALLTSSCPGKQK